MRGIQDRPGLPLLVGATIATGGLALGFASLALAAAAITALVALVQLAPSLGRLLRSGLEPGLPSTGLALAALAGAVLIATAALGWWEPLLEVYRQRNWEAIGAIGEGVIGAVGQILLALVALMIAWRQYVMEQRLTSQQNRITQAQTIDSFIHGVSELISDGEGFLEDWPLERMLAEGRLAAVMASLDGTGKAAILRFLSHARLLTPLQRDRRLGRPILDGNGHYAEDRLDGVPVIHLGNLLAGADLAGTDLSGVDFNGADLRGTVLRGCGLAEANLAGADLRGADLRGSQVAGTRFCYGEAHTASPAGGDGPASLETGLGTGARLEGALLQGLRQVSAETATYLSRWGANRPRLALPLGPPQS
ncbi:MAG: pentapeptide repeat-containing protein [Synechococcus sp. Tobar2m-G35]|nr:pentapeptide repeat-containing protein [Synechococcus sp. Tobar2m-G35]